ncbi:MULTISPECIES: hypothetical protein [unclassified Maridesulfovibrio]|uniref:hypothetical protein n=1 Tax=unclassified Maridesulfovibrio TaxID=2794999 RepID=UPI003B40313C
MQEDKIELAYMMREAMALQQELKEGEEVRVMLDSDFSFEIGPADHSVPNFDSVPAAVASISKKDDAGVVFEVMYDALQSSKTGSF